MISTRRFFACPSGFAWWDIPSRMVWTSRMVSAERIRPGFLVVTDGTPDRRLYETAVLATLRDRLRSDDGPPPMGTSRRSWGEVLRLVSSLRAGIVLSSAMLKKLAAYHRQKRHLHPCRCAPACPGSRRVD
jgi:hypothetical protein